jgi:hypothetical protein
MEQVVIEVVMQNFSDTHTAPCFNDAADVTKAMV